MSALDPVILNEVKLTQKAIADLTGSSSSGPTEYPWYVFTSSKSWTVPDDGVYFILCLGGGGGTGRSHDARRGHHTRAGPGLGLHRHNRLGDDGRGRFRLGSRNRLLDRDRKSLRRTVGHSAGSIEKLRLFGAVLRQPGIFPVPPVPALLFRLNLGLNAEEKTAQKI